jgi:hypothetical protein
LEQETEEGSLQHLDITIIRQALSMEDIIKRKGGKNPPLKTERGIALDEKD